MAVKPQPQEIQIVEINQSSIEFCILGTSPLIFNRMAEKAKRELLAPKGKKTAADKAAQMKHNPVDEFRNSMYKHETDDHPTRLKFPAPAFKGAMATAALDLPGMKKSEIGRLCWVEGVSANIYGIPQLHMGVVRSADMNRTPDIRTRAIVEHWCARIKVWFVQPKLRAGAIANILAASGVTCGIGDFRQEKGKGNYGQYVVVGDDNPDFRFLEANCGREAQDAAIAVAEPYDADAAELLAWWKSEFEKR
jgi:hypothetical protein